MEDKDIDRLKEIFITRRECDVITEDINKKLANDNTQLSLIEQQLATITWVAKTTLASVIGLLVTYIASTFLR